MTHKTIADNIVNAMRNALKTERISLLREALNLELAQVIITERRDDAAQNIADNQKLKERFVAAKKIEGCSSKTLDYYEKTISHYLDATTSAIVHLTTDDVRDYLVHYQETSRAGKVTIDNVRRILSSFFAWLEDEDYIAKSPVRRIHKVKTDSLVKDVLADEQLEQLRDACKCSRDLALVDLCAAKAIMFGKIHRKPNKRVFAKSLSTDIAHCRCCPDLIVTRSTDMPISLRKSSVFYVNN